MNSIFSFVVSIITAALSLLGFVQQHPELPQSSRDQAQIVATQAITQATQALNNANAQRSAPSQSLSLTISSNAENGYSGTFSATPRSGNALLAVTFSDTILRNTANGGGYIDYGDGTTCDTDADIACGMYRHTYTVPGTYTAVLHAHMPSVEVARVTIKVTNGIVQDISVSGMQKYTDADFGFSFWYPTGVLVRERTLSTQETNSFGAGTAQNSTRVCPEVDICFDLNKVYSASRSLLAPNRTPGSEPQCFSFDTNSHEWESFNCATNSGYQAADVSINTMGGLHVLGYQVVPLSAHNFLVLTGDINGAQKTFALIKTIIATDPSVATPASIEEQTRTIQAEKDAYASH